MTRYQDRSERLVNMQMSRPKPTCRIEATCKCQSAGTNGANMQNGETPNAQTQKCDANRQKCKAQNGQSVKHVKRTEQAGVTGPTWPNVKAEVKGRQTNTARMSIPSQHKGFKPCETKQLVPTQIMDSIRFKICTLAISKPMREISSVPPKW